MPGLAWTHGASTALAAEDVSELGRTMRSALGPVRVFCLSCLPLRVGSAAGAAREFE